MTEAILDQDTLVGTDARAGYGCEEPLLEVTGRPFARISQAWIQRDITDYSGSGDLVTASAEHSARIVRGSHVVAIPPARFDIPDPSASHLLFHMYIPQETWTIPRFSVYSESEPGYLDVEFADTVRQAKARFTTADDAANHYVQPVKTTSFWAEAERGYRRLRDGLARALEENPIEDGMMHPADALIERALGISRSSCIEALVRMFREFCMPQPAMSAAILRCMARLDSDEVGASGLALAQHALGHDDTEVREAAVRLLETWGGTKALGILRQHDDTEVWLHEYVSRVITDLSDALP